jgi:CheY-like chemotaxis protein
MSKATVLIVEDDALVALNIEGKLRELGYGVPAVCDTGPEAIAKAASLRPDLVLMDIRLRGELDGIQAAAEISRRHGIPVVYLTAFSDDETLQRAKVAEPFGYITKPFRIGDLHSLVEMAIYRHGLEQKLQAAKDAADQALRQERRRRIVAEGLADILGALNAGQTLTEVFALVARQAQTSLESDGVAILRWDQAAGRYEIEAAQGLAPGMATEADAMLALGELHELLRSQEYTIFCEPGHRFPAASEGPPPGRWSARYGTLLAVPLRIEAGEYGTLLCCYAAARAVSSHDVELATRLGGQLALAVENERSRWRPEGQPQISIMGISKR